MRNDTNQNFTQIIEDSTTLSKCYHKCQQLKLLNSILQQNIPTKLIGNCNIVNLQQGNLTIGVCSSIWVSELKYQRIELLMKLKRHSQFSNINNIKVKVIPESSIFNKYANHDTDAINNNTKKTVVASDLSINLMTYGASYIKCNKLATSLKNLANTLSKKIKL